MYPLLPYLGASLSILASVAERMESFSPLSFPTTRTSRPTCAPSGYSGTSSSAMKSTALGSKRKKAKSCTGSAYSALSGTSSRFWNTASATTGPGRRTWRFVRIRPSDASTTNPVAYALDADSVSKARAPVVLITTTAWETRVTTLCHRESDEGTGASSGSNPSPIADARGGAGRGRGGGVEARGRGERRGRRCDPPERKPPGARGREKAPRARANDAARREGGLAADAGARDGAACIPARVRTRRGVTGGSREERPG